MMIWQALQNNLTFVADALHLSANYFGDLIKKKTGKTTKEYIKTKKIDVAINKITIQKPISRK